MSAMVYIILNSLIGCHYLPETLHVTQQIETPSQVMNGCYYPAIKIFLQCFNKSNAKVIIQMENQVAFIFYIQLKQIDNIKVIIIALIVKIVNRLFGLRLRHMPIADTVYFFYFKTRGILSDIYHTDSDITIPKRMNQLIAERSYPVYRSAAGSIENIKIHKLIEN